VHLLWRVTGTFFQKTISAGQIISALLIRLRISFTKQLLINLRVNGPGKLRAGVKYWFEGFKDKQGKHVIITSALRVNNN
jgi:hypothetical protein